MQDETRKNNAGEKLFQDWKIGETFTFLKQDVESNMMPRLVDFGIDDLQATINDRDDTIAKLEAEISALTVEKATLSAENTALSKGCPEEKEQFVCFSRTSPSNW